MNLRNSHYESEQLEVKWPQKSDETGADGTFQRTKRPAEDFDDDRKPLVTPVAVQMVICGSTSPWLNDYYVLHAVYYQPQWAIEPCYMILQVLP